AFGRVRSLRAVRQRTVPSTSRTLLSRSTLTSFMFFFFKQKTAYEIGLGIPAEPLFRSPEIRAHDNRPLLVMRSNLWASGYDVDGTDQTSRSEERRVGKECRSRGGASH